jgi:hypothetical protein
MPPLPPFLQSGEDDARFYALAYCRGAYGTEEPRTEPVFLVLYYCTSPLFTRYSLHIVDADGHCYAYSRGYDSRDTAEYTMMQAWARRGVAPAIWRLFPLAGIAEDAWREGSEDREAYSAARADFCRIVHPFRIHSHFRLPPSFHPDPDFVPPSIMAGQPSEEGREILKAVMEAYRDPEPVQDDDEG